MNFENLNFVFGENPSQKVYIESNDKTIDYNIKGSLTYIQFLSVVKGLSLISEFYDVNAACTVKGTGVCAVALGQSISDAVQKIIDSNPIDFMDAVVLISTEVDSETARFFKASNIIVAPKFTKNAIEYLENKNITYISINTALKDYKTYLSNEIKVTPLGTITQTPNISELTKDSFKVVTLIKPTVEQIEDAVFAWKVAKHCTSQAIVVAKDLKTTAIAQGLLTASVEFALDYSCDMSKDAILASDMPITQHDLNVASQGRIALIIVPFADNCLIELANKYNISIITTGFTNILY